MNTPLILYSKASLLWMNSFSTFLTPPFSVSKSTVVKQVSVRFHHLRWLTSSLVCLDQARLQTWDPVSVHCRGWPVRVFQKRMQRSAVPPPDASRPCWWGDQAIAFTAAKCSVYCWTGTTLEWFHTSNCRTKWDVQSGVCDETWTNRRFLHFLYLVIVPSWGQQLMVCAPLEPTDFLPVSLETAFRLERRGSDVPLQDHAITTPRRQLVCIPRQGTWQREAKGRSKGRWFTRHELQRWTITSANVNEGWHPLGLWTTHPLWRCVPLKQRASCLLLHPRSERSPYEFPLPPGSPKKKKKKIHFNLIFTRTLELCGGLQSLFST